MNEPITVKPTKKKLDLGTIAFAKIKKIEARLVVLEDIVKSLPPPK